MRAFLLWITTVVLLVIALGTAGTCDDNDNDSGPDIWAVQINVTDLDSAIWFYSDLLGMEIATREYYPQVVSLVNDGAHIVLYRVDSAAAPEARALGCIPNFQVSDLEAAVAKLRDHDVTIVSDGPERNAIGYAMKVLDPSGNPLHLMELDAQHGTVEKTGFFNISYPVSDRVAALGFYRDALGFGVFGEQYWPPVQPLRSSGAQIVLKNSATVAALAYSNSTAAYVIIEVSDIEAAVAGLREMGHAPVFDDLIEHAPVGAYTAYRDPFGNIIELIEPTDNAFDRARERLGQHPAR